MNNNTKFFKMVKSDPKKLNITQSVAAPNDAEIIFLKNRIYILFGIDCSKMDKTHLFECINSNDIGDICREELLLRRKKIC